MQSYYLKLLVHDNLAFNPSELLDQIAEIDPSAQIKRTWGSVLQHLECSVLKATDIIIDIIDATPGVAAEHLNQLSELRRRHNYSPTPLYLAISVQTQPLVVRHSIRCLGGRFIYMAHVPAHFLEEIEEIRLELAELKLNVPQWEIVEEGEVPAKRAYVHHRFRGKNPRVKGSDLESAVLAVMIRNNSNRAFSSGHSAKASNKSERCSVDSCRSEIASRSSCFSLSVILPSSNSLRMS